MKKNLLKTREGSALLIAILIMGILIVLTLGLSDLVIREIRQTSDVVSAGKAYFAAEAGIENALIDLREHLPGYETPAGPDDNYVTVDPSADLQDSKALNGRYRILNKADKVPYFDPDKPIFLGNNQVPTNVNFVYQEHAEATYNDLPLSESVVIPLYSEDENGQPLKVDDFLIEYYMDFDEDEVKASGIPSHEFNELDILRWKIFGKPSEGSNTTRTEAISDFFPATFDANKDKPMCIGTDDSITPAKNGCFRPIPVINGQDQINLWGAARECYLSDAGGGGGVSNDIQNTCTIQNFVDHHVQNYLVLTNVVNPDVLLPGRSLKTADAKAKFTIHYRVVAKSGEGEPKLVREAAAVSADGYAENGKIKQSIDVKIHQSSFLPVFNFSLYHTKTN